MAKKKKKRKLKKGIKLIVIILIIIIIYYIFISNNNNNNIKLINKLELELGSNATISSIIKSSNVDIINKDDVIDTSNLGNKEVTIKYKENKSVKNYKVKLKIVDTEIPTILCEDNINILINNNIKLDDIIKISDNSKESIKPTIEGDYNLDQEGEYQIKVIAKDSSNNTNTKNITLHVLKSINYNSDGSLVDGTYTTSKGYSLKVINGIAKINDIVIVNKTYSLPSSYTPNNPYKSIAGRGYCTDCMEDFVVEAFLKMQEDAEKEGLKLWVGSGFRSYNTQKTLYENYVSQDGKEAADTYSARAGYSEHQSGLCFDLNSDSDAFTNTKEGKWVNDNAYKYGLVIRFPNGKEKYTGYEYESWHLRYVGEDLAKELYNDGDWLSLEEYFGVTSKYPD